MRISDWSSDVCSSDLVLVVTPAQHLGAILGNAPVGNLPLILCSKGIEAGSQRLMSEVAASVHPGAPIAVLSGPTRSEEHTSELQSLMRISYAVFCLKKKNIKPKQPCTTAQGTMRRNSTAPN